MPLYEYVCQKCARRTEVIQAFGERRIRMCPHCGGKVKKAFSAPAIQFKGSGFYITDYAKGKTGEKGSDKGAEKPSEKLAEKPAEKPAEKAAEKKKESKEKKPARASDP
jgi:putative FmdB family regulatory protein